jgi:hypothetical protein
LEDATRISAAHGESEKKITQKFDYVKPTILLHFEAYFQIVTEAMHEPLNQTDA